MGQKAVMIQGGVGGEDKERQERNLEKRGGGGDNGSG